MSVILVVDDETMILDLATRILSKAQHTVVTAKTALEAQAAFAEHAGEIVVIILDYSLPDTSGADLLRQFRTLRPDVRCIISSGFPLSSTDLPADLLPHTRFLQKPYRSSQLLEAVREAITSIGAP